MKQYINKKKIIDSNELLIKSDVGRHAGNIVRYIKFPDFNELGISPNSTGDWSDYYKALLKWIVSSNPNSYGGIYIGNTCPVSTGISIVYVYDYNPSFDNINGDLPYCACGWDLHYTGRLYTFGCFNKTEFWAKESQTLVITPEGNPIT